MNHPGTEYCPKCKEWIGDCDCPSTPDYEGNQGRETEYCPGCNQILGDCDCHPVHLWSDDDGHYWDDSEDHGGFDRNVPSGPFDTREAATQDAKELFGNITIVDGKPSRYGETRE